MFLSNFSAVNESSSSSSAGSESDEISRKRNREMENLQQELAEEKYVGLYNKGLSLYGHKENFRGAQNTFREILDSGYFTKFPSTPVSLKLHFNVLKYLGFCAEKRGKYDDCIRFLESAIRVDPTDIGLYFKIGLNSVRINDLYLGKSALIDGLRLNPIHFPSLELIIMITYKMKDHFSCLNYIDEARELNPHCDKINEIKDKIIWENLQKGIDFGMEPSRPMPPDFISPKMWDPPKSPEKPQEIKSREIKVADESFSGLINLILTEYDVVLNKEGGEELLTDVRVLKCEKPPMLQVTIQNIVNEMVDYVVENEKQEAEKIVKPIIDELIAEIPPYKTIDFVSDILTDIITKVATIGDDTFADFTDTTAEIRRSSRAKVNDKSNEVSKSGIDDDTAKSHLESFVPKCLLATNLEGSKDDKNKEDEEEELMKVEFKKFEVNITREIETELFNEFIEVLKLKENNGIVDLIKQILIYLMNLGSSSYCWSEELTDYFWKLYVPWRRHFVLQNDEEEEIGIEFQIILMANEAFLDCQERGVKFLIQDFLDQDLLFIKMNGNNLNYNWQIRKESVILAHYLNEEEPYFSTHYGNSLKTLHELNENNDIILPFTRYHVKKIREIENCLELLRRASLVDELSQLYKKKQYETIVNVLKTSLSEEPEERAYQLSILIDSLWNIDDYSHCLKWTGVAICDFMETKLKGTTKTRKSLLFLLKKLLFLNFNLLGPTK